MPLPAKNLALPLLLFLLANHPALACSPCKQGVEDWRFFTSDQRSCDSAFKAGQCCDINQDDPCEPGVSLNASFTSNLLDTPNATCWRTLPVEVPEHTCNASDVQAVLSNDRLFRLRVCVYASTFPRLNWTYVWRNCSKPVSASPSGPSPFWLALLFLPLLLLFP